MVRPGSHTVRPRSRRGRPRSRLSHARSRLGCPRCWLAMVVLLGPLLPFLATLLPSSLPAQQPVLVEVTESSMNKVAAHLSIQDKAAPIDAAWRAGRHQDVLRFAAGMIASNEKDYRGHALKYLALVELQRDRKLASKAALDATKNLGKDPRAMAEFLNRALYVEARVNEYQLALMALVPLVPEGRQIAAVRIAHIRALVGCGKVKEALATNKTIVQDLSKNTDDLLALAEAICDMAGQKRAQPLGAIARQALDRALGSGGPASETPRTTSRPNARCRLADYRILHDFEGDKKAGLKLADVIVAEAAKGGSLNNWLWYLMTRRATADKYNSLALVAARKLAENNTDPNELDTVALALFKNGLIDEAVETQERAAVQGASVGVLRRLKMYRAAQAQQKKRQRIRQQKPSKKPKSRPQVGK